VLEREKRFVGLDLQMNITSLQTSLKRCRHAGMFAVAIGYRISAVSARLSRKLSGGTVTPVALYVLPIKQIVFFDKRDALPRDPRLPFISYRVQVLIGFGST
jgi:hypothetical protein